MINPEKVTLKQGLDEATRMHHDATVKGDVQGTRLAMALLAILNELQRKALR